MHVLPPLAGAALLLATVTHPAAPAGKKTRPHLVVIDANREIRKSGYQRILDREEWTKVWLRNLGQEQRYFGRPGQEDGYDCLHDPAGVPVVNFEDCMVIAVFGGAGVNRAGLNADSLVEREDAVVLRYSPKSYQTGQEGVPVSVYGFFVVPRSAKAVVLEEGVVELIGQKPKWQERKRFASLPSDSR